MDIREDSIVWSGQEFLLKDFLERFPLPQIIKVEEGYHDELEEDRTLSSSQLLILHTIKELATIKATIDSSLEVLLPTDAKSKVLVLNRKDVAGYYDSVQDLANGFPKFAVSENVLQCFNVFEDEVLELKKKIKKHREQFLVCVVVNQNRTVELPFTFKGRFKALGNCPSVSPTLAEVIKYYELPCTVKFLDNSIKLVRDEFDRPHGFSILGPVKLHSVNHYKVVFTTTWEDNKATSVLPLPMDIEVRVVAALGAIQSDDKYARLCKIAQDKTKSEQLVLKSIRHGPCKVTLEDITEPKDDDEGSNYTEIAPKLPPRNFKSQRKAAPIPGPKPRSKSTADIPHGESLPSPTKELNDEVFDEESIISVKESGKTRSISLNLGKLPPSSCEAVEFEGGASSPSAVAPSNSHNIFRQSSLNFGKLFSPLKKVPSKVGKIKALNRRSCASNGTTVEGSEYREVNPIQGTSADRLNTELLTALNIKTKNEPINGLDIENPGDIQSWSVGDVAKVLEFCHLDMYIEKFKEEQIDGVLLSSLNNEALESFGIENILHRKKILKIIDGWLPKTG